MAYWKIGPCAAKVRFSALNKKSMIGCPALSPHELKLALANLKGRFALRDRALVTLGVRTGLRISELLALNVGQVWDGKRTVARFYIARQNTKGKHAGASIVFHPEASVLEEGMPPVLTEIWNSEFKRARRTFIDAE